MVAPGSWIIDKSAYVRLLSSPDSDLWLDRIGRGLLRVASVTLLEMGFSARSAQDWRESIHRPPISSLLIENLTPRMEARAVEVQGAKGQRAASADFSQGRLVTRSVGVLGESAGHGKVGDQHIDPLSAQSRPDSGELAFAAGDPDAARDGGQFGRGDADQPLVEA